MPPLPECLECARHKVSGLIRYGELVLQEARWTVDAVPILHTIERLEERRDRLQFTFPMLRGLAIPGFIERPHRELVQQAAWQERWSRG